MELKNKNNKPVKIVKYPLASAGRRLAVKVLDIVLTSLIVVGFGCLILCTTPNPKDLTTIPTWRYTVVAIVGVIVYFVYFLLIPFFTKKTLFMKAFKLQYVNSLPLSNFMLGLFKHELLIWGIISIISLIAGIVLGASGSPENAANMINGMLKQSNNSTWNYVGIGFSAAYVVAFLATLFVLIDTCVRNKKPAFHDKFSNVFVIHLTSTNTPDKQTNTKKVIKSKVNYGVPGEISQGAFEEIDGL